MYRVGRMNGSVVIVLIVCVEWFVLDFNYLFEGFCAV